ncbi:hypothetical protein ES702_01468 [subsurface metagenome]
MLSPSFHDVETILATISVTVILFHVSLIKSPASILTWSAIISFVINMSVVLVKVNGFPFIPYIVTWVSSYIDEST